MNVKIKTKRQKNQESPSLLLHERGGEERERETLKGRLNFSYSRALLKSSGQGGEIVDGSQSEGHPFIPGEREERGGPS